MSCEHGIDCDERAHCSLERQAKECRYIVAESTLIAPNALKLFFLSFTSFFLIGKNLLMFRQLSLRSLLLRVRFIAVVYYIIL